MAFSDITCSALIATGGIGQIVLTWAVNDPNARGLQYLAVETVEVWASATNDRDDADKVGEGVTSFTHAGLNEGDTLFYWIKARSRSQQYGEWFPVSPTAGVSATVAVTVPDGSIGSAQIDDGAVTAPKLGPEAVESAKIAPGAVTQAKITDGSVSTSKVADSAITTAKIGYAQITGANIATAEITSAHIVSVAANKISAGTITAVTINGGTISGGYVSGATITGGAIQGVSIMTTDFKSSSTNPRVEIGYSVLQVKNVYGTVVLEMIGSTSSPILNIDTSLSSAFVASFRNASAAAVQGRSPTFAFYASTGAYGPFTGSHTVLWPRSEPLPEPGDLVADGAIMFRNGLSNTISVGKHSVANKPALGVFVTEAWMNRPAAIGDDVSARDLVALRRDYTMLLINALGEGQINVCDEGGPIEAGDLLVASSTPGKAMRQDDDLVRAKTVARSRENVVFNASGHARAACIYVSG